jgi:biotin carboxyl carrier protein
MGRPRPGELVDVMATRVRARVDNADWAVDVAGTHVTVGDAAGMIDVRDDSDGRWRVTRGDSSEIAAAALVGDVVWVTTGGELFGIEVDRTGGAIRSTSRGRDALSAPMPATVVRVAAEVGARVSRGDSLVVLEAMKMELSIKAPADGVVTAVHCREGQLVQAGTVLVDLE